MTSEIPPGQSYPLGATLFDDGVNFSVYSKHSLAMELLLFDSIDAAEPSRTIELDPASHHRTFHYWHAFVPGVKAGQVYAFRAFGPFEPSHGLRFDSSRVLLDPYSPCVAVPEGYNRDRLSAGPPDVAHSMKSVVADLSQFDWEGDMSPHHPYSKTVIYELHVRGFTRHPSSGVSDDLAGTYRGLIEKIPYLQELGVTAVELLPVFQFDPHDAPDGRMNYWGYNPVSFFAPHTGYSSTGHPLDALNEFREMVKALHRANIEVILDVVYNHTAEGSELGPTFCFKGFANNAYYILDPNNRSRYANYSGTGNTLNANHAVVRRLILDSLRFWVEEMHVDGFRFDLAAVLSRDLSGMPLANPPILWDIETDPVLSGTKLIAEAWDAAGLYQVGSFFGDHWKEWNGRFRDDVRAFVKGDRGFAGKLASRFLASPDIYGHDKREPEQSVNFVTCHDGFTLNDLVSYNQKHNELNGEGNRDGDNHNNSWNCGEEGPTDDPVIDRLRQRQIKNFFAINLLSMGVPMLLMGDEMRRTQNGNNNAYCHDTDWNWLNWDLLAENRDVFEFVRKLIHFRRSLPRVNNHDVSLAELLRTTPIHWHGVKLNQPDWSEHSHCVAFTVEGHLHRFHLIANAYWQDLEFELPLPPDGRCWQRVIDTALESPHDLSTHPEQLCDHDRYLVVARSLVLLMASNN